MLEVSFILIAEDSDPKELVVSASCGKSGGSHQLMLRLSRAPGTQIQSLPANTAVPEPVSRQKLPATEESCMGEGKYD